MAVALCTFILTSPLIGNEGLDEPLAKEELSSARLRFLVASGRLEAALSCYLSAKSQKSVDDDLFLSDLAIHLIDNALMDPDPKIQLAGLYGLSLSAHPSGLLLLEQLSNSLQPIIQAIAVQMAKLAPDPTATFIINRALNSNYIEIRFHALQFLVMRKDPTAFGHIQSLLHKLPPQAKPYFCDFLASLGTQESEFLLVDFFLSNSPTLRMHVLQSALNHTLFSFLPHFQNSLHVGVPQEQEISAFAMSRFGQIESQGLLKKLQNSPHPEVRLAAATSLLSFGFVDALQTVIELAKMKNLWAIDLLGSYAGGETLLKELFFDSDPNIQLNAMLSLLKRKEPCALEQAKKILKTPSHIALFTPIYSEGGSFKAWKIFSPTQTPSPEEQQRALLATFELKNQILILGMELPEEAFFEILETIIHLRENSFAPLIAQITQNMKTPRTKARLLDLSQESGWPLLRIFSHFILYVNGDKNRHKKELLRWIHEEKKRSVIEFKPSTSFLDSYEKSSPYELTPEESSALFIETLAAMASMQDPEGIDLILQLIKDGHVNNRPILAGLLFKILQ